MTTNNAQGNDAGETLANLDLSTFDLTPDTEIQSDTGNTEAQPDEVTGDLSNVAVSETKTPVYDTREYDASGKQVSGSVYYSWDDLAKAAKEKDAVTSRLKHWGDARAKEAQQLKAQLEARDRAQVTVAQPQAQTQTVKSDGSFRFPENVRDRISDDVLPALEQAFGELRNELHEVKKELQTAPQIALKQMDEQRRINEDRQMVNQLIATHPNEYPDFNTALIAENDPLHPQYEQARRLAEVVALGQYIGSFERAHTMIRGEQMANDTQKAINDALERGRKEGEQAVIARLKEHGAQLVPKGTMNGSRGVPSASEINKLSPEDFHKLQVSKFSNIDKELAEIKI
jgi:hypothetical protein